MKLTDGRWLAKWRELHSWLPRKLVSSGAEQSSRSARLGQLVLCLNYLNPVKATKIVLGKVGWRPTSFWPQIWRQAISHVFPIPIYFLFHVYFLIHKSSQMLWGFQPVLAIIKIFFQFCIQGNSVLPCNCMFLFSHLDWGVSLEWVQKKWTG